MSYLINSIIPQICNSVQMSNIGNIFFFRKKFIPQKIICTQGREIKNHIAGFINRGSCTVSLWTLNNLVMSNRLGLKGSCWIPMIGARISYLRK